MNRLSFLKKLGIGMVAVVVAPKIISGSYNPSTDLDDLKDHLNSLGITSRNVTFPTNYTEGLIPFIRKNATKWKM